MAGKPLKCPHPGCNGTLDPDNWKGEGFEANNPKGSPVDAGRTEATICGECGQPVVTLAIFGSGQARQVDEFNVYPIDDAVLDLLVDLYSDMAIQAIEKYERPVSEEEKRDIKQRVRKGLIDVLCRYVPRVAGEAISRVPQIQELLSNLPSF